MMDGENKARGQEEEGDRDMLRGISNSSHNNSNNGSSLD